MREGNMYEGCRYLAHTKIMQTIILFNHSPLGDIQFVFRNYRGLEDSRNQFVAEFFMQLNGQFFFVFVPTISVEHFTFIPLLFI